MYFYTQDIKRKKTNMKVEKFNEKMNIVNSADMENWSAKESNAREKLKDVSNRLQDLSSKMSQYNMQFNTKKIDIELGSKVIDLLAKYGLGIESIGTGNWLHGQKLVLPDETNFKEYRVHIGKKPNWDDFIYDYEPSNTSSPLVQRYYAVI